MEIPRWPPWETALQGLLPRHRLPTPCPRALSRRRQTWATSWQSCGRWTAISPSSPEPWRSWHHRWHRSKMHVAPHLLSARLCTGSPCWVSWKRVGNDQGQPMVEVGWRKGTLPKPACSVCASSLCSLTPTSSPQWVFLLVCLFPPCKWLHILKNSFVVLLIKLFIFLAFLSDVPAPLLSPINHTSAGRNWWGLAQWMQRIWSGEKLPTTKRSGRWQNPSWQCGGTQTGKNTIKLWKNFLFLSIHSAWHGSVEVGALPSALNLRGNYNYQCRYGLWQIVQNTVQVSCLKQYMVWSATKQRHQPLVLRESVNWRQCIWFICQWCLGFFKHINLQQLARHTWVDPNILPSFSYCQAAVACLKVALKAWYLEQSSLWVRKELLGTNPGLAPPRCVTWRAAYEVPSDIAWPGRGTRARNWRLGWPQCSGRAPEKRTRSSGKAILFISATVCP